MASDMVIILRARDIEDPYLEALNSCAIAAKKSLRWVDRAIRKGDYNPVKNYIETQDLVGFIHGVAFRAECIRRDSEAKRHGSHTQTVRSDQARHLIRVCASQMDQLLGFIGECDASLEPTPSLPVDAEEAHAQALRRASEAILPRAREYYYRKATEAADVLDRHKPPGSATQPTPTDSSTCGSGELPGQEPSGGQPSGREPSGREPSEREGKPGTWLKSPPADRRSEQHQEEGHSREQRDEERLESRPMEEEQLQGEGNGLEQGGFREHELVQEDENLLGLVEPLEVYASPERGEEELGGAPAEQRAMTPERRAGSDGQQERFEWFDSWSAQRDEMLTSAYDMFEEHDHRSKAIQATSTASLPSGEIGGQERQIEGYRTYIKPRKKSHAPHKASADAPEQTRPSGHHAITAKAGDEAAPADPKTSCRYTLVEGYRTYIKVRVGPEGFPKDDTAAQQPPPDPLPRPPAPPEPAIAARPEEEERTPASPIPIPTPAPADQGSRRKRRRTSPDGDGDDALWGVPYATALAGGAVADHELLARLLPAARRVLARRRRGGGDDDDDDDGLLGFATAAEARGAAETVVATWELADAVGRFGERAGVGGLLGTREVVLDGRKVTVGVV